MTAGKSRERKTPRQESKLDRPPPGRAVTERTAWTTRKSGGIHILQAAGLTELRWLVHGFSTRLGGTSRLDGERVLNLGSTDWDTRQNVRANRQAFLAALGAEQMQLALLRQFHSDVIHTLEGPPGDALDGDAAITQSAGLLLAIQTADCVPILLVDARQRAIAAVHAGWRGTLRRIAEKTVGRMQMVFRARPEDLLAALGPAIRSCCYEVGPEVAQAYASEFAQAGEWFQGARLDLVGANRWQLLQAGLPESNIISSELCTACRTDLLFSYRREGRTGRLMAAIGIGPASSRTQR